MNTKLAINLLTEAGNNLTVTLAALGLLDNGETIKSLQQKIDQSIKAAFDKQLQLSSKLDIAEGKLQVADEALRLAVSHNTTEQERLLSLKKEQGQLQIAIKNLEDKKKILADNGNGDKGKIKQEIETIKGKINTTDAQIKDLTQKITDGLALVARYDNLIIQGNTAQNNANYHNQFVQRWDVVGYESGRSGKKKAIYGWVTNQEQVNLRDGYQNQANQLRAEANSIQGAVDDFNKNKSILQETKDSKNNELWLLYHELDAKNNLLSFVGTRSDNELALVNLQLDQAKEDLQQLQKTEIPSQEKTAQATNLKVTQSQSDLDKLKTDKLSAQKDLDNFVKDNKELLTTDLSLGLLKDAITKVQNKIASLKGDLAKPNQSATIIKGLNEAIAVEQGKLGQLKQQYQLLGLEALEINQGRLDSFNQQQATETSVNDAVKLDTIEGYVVLLPQLVQQMTGLSDVWGENLKQNHGFTVEVNNLFENNLTAFDGLTKYIGDKFAVPYSDYSLNKIQLDEAIALQDTQVKYRDALAQAADDLGENIALQKKAVEQADALSGKLEHIKNLIKYEKDYATLGNQASSSLRSQLIDSLNTGIVNKAQGLVFQIDLTNDQQEQWIETNLQKYIEQKQNSIVKAQEAPLTAIRETFEQPNRALFFDGVNDYIQINLNEPETEVTHELWFKTTSLNGGLFSVVAGNLGSGGHDRHIYLSNGNIVVRIWNNEVIASSGLNLADGKWHHVAHVFGASVGGQQIYVDGQLVASGSRTISDFGGQDKIVVGYSADSGYFKGEIDEVRVWNVAKTQAQIQTYYNRNLTGKEQGLAGYWNFEEITGNTVNDLTANKNNGTLTNGVQRTVANTNPITRPEGKTLYFDGVNDYINAGTNPSLKVTNTLTLEAWINPQQDSRTRMIVGREGEYLLALSGADNIIYYALANSNPGWNWISTGYGVKSNQWSHVAFSYENGRIKTYVNGQLIYTYDGVGTIGDVSSQDELRIGNRQWNNYDSFKGEMDEVRVWNIARTQAEIQANINQKLSGNEQGLVGYWNFEEATGNTVNDLTANKNNGTLINGVQRTVANTNLIIRPEGKALYFDGVNDYINAGTNPSLEVGKTLTLEAWIKPQQNSQQGVIISREGEYRLAIGTENTIYFAIANGNPSWSWINTGYKINLNQWSHIALTYDKGLIKTYVGGELVYSYDGAGIIGDHSLHANQDDLRIGNRQWQNLDSFKGEMDEVRVWNVTRNQAEIQANLNQKLIGNEQGLVGYWNFEEATGNTVNDLTTNKNNGTLINGVQRTVANSNPITRPEGKALYFDGVNDSIQMNLNEPETEVTHELWFKTTSLNGGLFSVIAGSGGHDRSIHLSNGNIVVRIWNNEVIASSGLNLADGKWHHVAHVFGASVGGQQIYVDGQLVASGSRTVSDFNWQDKISIGYSADSGYFKGEIDEVRVWNVAKTQSQIQASLNQKLTGNEQGLIGYWNFEENTGNTVNDLTANKNNGTLTNGVQRTIDSSIAVPQVVTEQTNIIESKTIADLQTLRLETAYLTLQAEKDPDKLQKYLQTYNSLKILGTTDNQGTDLSLFDIVTPLGSVYQDALRSDPGAWIIRGDYNGDGKTDFIRQEHGAWDDDPMATFSVYFSKGDGYFDVVIPLDSKYQDALRGDNGAFIIPGDYNGDGKTDFIRQEHGSWGSDTVGTFSIYFSKGDGNFDVFTPLGSQYQDALRATPGAWMIPGDYNGDGKTDFIRQEHSGWGSDTVGTFSIYFSKGDGYFDIVTPQGGVYQDWLRFGYGSYITPGDFNGDGKTDFIRQDKGGWDDDLNNSINIYFSKGNGYFYVITPNNADYQNYLRFDPGANIIPGDYNGDGKTDFIRQEKGGWDDDTIASFQIYVSRGDGYFDIITPENGVYQDWLRFDYGANIISGDYNGDGYDDFIRQEKGGWDDDLINNFNVYFSNPAKQQALKVLGANDGLKNITLNSLRTQYYPELNQANTLANLQQQINKEIGDSEKQIADLQSEITRKNSESAAALSQATWYEEQAATHWQLSRKAGPTWTEQRQEKGKSGKSKTVTITHVDHNWIIWDTYSKQAVSLREHSANLLKGVETDTTNQNTASEILKQWQAANAVADETSLTQAQLTTLLNQLDAQFKLNADKKQQIADWEKLLPTLQSQLDQAIKNAKTAALRELLCK